MKRWRSCAKWPEGTTSNAYGEPKSTDDHFTRDDAEAVCRLLEIHGFGGQEEIFPIRTWVEPIKEKEL